MKYLFCTLQHVVESDSVRHFFHGAIVPHTWLENKLKITDVHGYIFGLYPVAKKWNLLGNIH